MRNNVEIKNRTKRYAHLLWEFWKKDHELFPPGILDKNAKNETCPHSIVFVFDGSTEDVPNSEEEVKFYAKVIKQAKSKGTKRGEQTNPKATSIHSSF